MVERSTHASYELQSVYHRYQSFQKARSQGLAAGVDVWVSSSKLRDVLARGNDDELRPLVDAVDQSLEQTVDPDFIMVVDKHGDVVASKDCPIEAHEARS